MTDKHLFKINKRPTAEEFMSDTWTSRKPYVGLVKKDGGGGVDTDEVFYNFDGTKVTKLKVKIEKPGNYGLGYMGSTVSEDKPIIIDWGNGKTTTLPKLRAGSSNLYTNYDKPGEYVISIDGWHINFLCYYEYNNNPNFTQIHKVLTEIIQVSSLITNFNNTFENCARLTSIPSGLFDKNTNVTYFYKTFSGCSNLTGETPYTLLSNGKKIKLWERDATNGFVKPTSTSGAFRYCTGLTDYNEIPDTWK